MPGKGLKSFLIEHPGKRSSATVPELVQSDERVQEISDLLKGSDPSSCVRVILLATGGAITRVSVAPHVGEDDEHLDVSNFFPNGAYSVRASVLPGTDDKLPCDWRIYVSSFVIKPPRNRAIEAKFGRKWLGNILVAKYHQEEGCVTFVNATGSDMELACTLLYRWIKHFDLLWRKYTQSVINGPST